MQIVDTHTHIYLEQFKEDLPEVIRRAQGMGVAHFCLPNIDTDSVAGIQQLCQDYPGMMHPMWGIHPCSVDQNWRKQWEEMLPLFDTPGTIAVGEIGIDLYWDKQYINEQKEALREQCLFAIESDLPVAIHVREAFPELFEVFDGLDTSKLKGVFHCFSGDSAIIEKAKSYPHFYFGIGGVVTFKNGGLNKVLHEIPTSRMILETDAPYLAPKPYRGKRNEPSYLVYILEEMERILGIATAQLAEETTANAHQLFKL